MSSTKKYHFGNHTDVGRVRSQNEDYMGFFENENGSFFVVCDGMGGHVGGAVASQTAVRAIRQFFDREKYSHPKEAIYQAIQFANHQIYQQALQRPDLKGMGTTCVLLQIVEDKIYLGHVGDSRIYLYREGNMRRLTRDHSFVQALVDQGLINEEEAEKHPRRNELLRALGTNEFVDVEVSEEDLKAFVGDVFLLCSDGLNTMVSDRGIQEVLNSDLDIQRKAIRLVEVANTLGGSDNITVQLIEFKDEMDYGGYGGEDYSSQGNTSPWDTPTSSYTGNNYSQSSGNFDPPVNYNYGQSQSQNIDPISENYYSSGSDSGMININSYDQMDLRPWLIRGFLVLFGFVFLYIVFQNTQPKLGGVVGSTGSLQSDSAKAIELQNRFYEYTGIQKVKDTYQKTKETIENTTETLRRTKKKFDEFNEYQKRKMQALDSFFRNKRVREVLNTLDGGQENLSSLARRYRSRMDWILKANGVESEEELKELDSLAIPLEAPEKKKEE